MSHTTGGGGGGSVFAICLVTLMQGPFGKFPGATLLVQEGVGKISLIIYSLPENGLILQLFRMCVAGLLLDFGTGDDSPAHFTRRGVFSNVGRCMEQDLE